MPRCSKEISSVVAVLALLLLLSPARQSAIAQTAVPTAPAQTTPQATPPAEQQPPLTVDTDPIRSPDPEEAPTIVRPPAGGKPGEITRTKSGGFVLRRDVEEVVLNATVLDGKDHLVTNLLKDDFHVYEDGVPQTIASFQHADIPISLGILIDNSGSMKTKRAAVNAAALDLVKSSNPEDEEFIVNFADEAFLDQEFTSDINKLREGLGHIDSKGGTALYDAIAAAADELAKDAKRAKQVLLIITDGEDNASALTLEQTIRKVQDLQGPTIYAIGLLFDESGHESRRARRALQMVTSETGGVSFFPKNLAQVDEIAAEVAHDIRNQYTIGYHSTKAAALGGYRLVHVDAKAPGYNKLNVRTRTGYFPTTAKSSPPPPPQPSNNKK